MAEIRTNAEGVLWWVQASGSGASWATASAPASGLFGYVDSFTYTSASRVVTQSDRGVPNHHKVVGKDPISVSVTFRWTGSYPTGLTGTGASVPMVHLEHKAVAPENGNTGRYHQFMGVPLSNFQFTEGESDTIQISTNALAMVGPTASGYLS